MTANQSAYAAILAMEERPASRIERVRARMASSKAFRSLHTMRAFQPPQQPVNQGLHLVSDSPRKTHPGDVLYWAACLGGAFLLLLTATT